MIRVCKKHLNLLNTCVRLHKHLRGCWNWQTGQTKDLVATSRVGSSPISRIAGSVVHEPRFGTALFLHRDTICKSH